MVMFIITFWSISNPRLPIIVITALTNSTALASPNSSHKSMILWTDTVIPPIVMSIPPLKAVSFGILDNNTIIKATTNNLSKSNVKQDNQKAGNTKYANNSNKPVRIKIIVLMEDKKNAKKIKIMAMLKGQVKSEMVDVQKEFDKIRGYTIERTFAFDRNIDRGPIEWK